jgi:hypothetical protein
VCRERSGLKGPGRVQFLFVNSCAGGSSLNRLAKPSYDVAEAGAAKRIAKLGR